MAANNGGRQLKVSRLIEEYDLQDVGDELEQRWTAADGRQSLRELETYFNTQLVAAVLAAANVDTLDGEIENTYRLLTDENVGEADRTRTRRRLEREGVDVDGLMDDFVTYQAIRTYLQRDRDVEYTREATDPVEREVDNVQQLQGRMTAVTEGKVEQLRETDHITVGDVRVIADIHVVCTDCNCQFTAVELFERDGCYCRD